MFFCFVWFLLLGNLAKLLLLIKFDIKVLHSPLCLAQDFMLLRALLSSCRKNTRKLCLGLQIPSKKVLWGVFRGLNTFLEGIWSPRVYKTCTKPQEKSRHWPSYDIFFWTVVEVFPRPFGFMFFS